LFDFGFESAQSIEDIKVLIVEEVKSYKEEIRAREARQNDAISPRRASKMISGPGVDQEYTSKVPRFEDTIHEGPTNIEEELHMRELKIAG
jgi:hypothetical protein